MYLHSTWSKRALVHELETALGDCLGSGIFSYARRVEEDEHESYPLEALRWLDRWGMQEHYVPVSAGGALCDFETLFSLVRAISRRDLTVAISHAVSFLGSAGVWIAGSEEQKAELSGRLRAGERVSLALTEGNHGGDLLSIETQACSRPDGRFLSGEKWLINGATRNSLLAVLARTDPNGGPRGFSLFLFDKAAAEPGSFECLKKVHTLGVRGSDISGIRFKDASLGRSAPVGGEGKGFEVVLKGLQLTRLLCGAISLGAVETAFQVVLDFALSRRIYGRTVFDMPQCRGLLVEAWVDLLLCDALMTAAARSLHFAPSEASVHSAVVKYLVPQILEQTMKQLSVILGARYYLREGHYHGIFQKMLRDHSLVSLFDGSSIVNLYVLTTQFKGLSHCWENARNHAKVRVAPVCELTEPLPEFDWSRLSLGAGGRNCFLESLPGSLEALRSLGGAHRPPAGVASALEQEAAKLENAAELLMREIGLISIAAPHAAVPKAFDKARDYCAVEAAAMILQTWLANRDQTSSCRTDHQWLALALTRLNGCLGQKTNLGHRLMEDLADQLVQTHGETLHSSHGSLCLSA